MKQLVNALRHILGDWFERAAPLVLAIGVFVGVCGGFYGLYEQHQVTQTSQSSHDLLIKIARDDAILCAVVTPFAAYPQLPLFEREQLQIATKSCPPLQLPKHHQAHRGRR